MTYRPKHRKPGMARRITRRMAALAAVTGALAVTTGATAHAGTAPHGGEVGFCHAFQTFGESPDFANLDRARYLAHWADPATRTLYWRFQWLLLGSRPHAAQDRADLDIYDSCARGGVTFRSKGN